MNKTTDAPTDPPAPPVDGLAGFRKSPQAIRAKREEREEALVDSLAAALRESAARYMCWPCWERKVLWDAQNHDVLEMARAQAAEAGSDDVLSFLPEPLQPADDDPLGETGRMPATFEVWTWISGTGVCALDAKDAILEQAAQRQAQAQAMAEQMARQQQAAAATEQQQPQQPASPQPRPQIIVAPAGPSIDTLAQAAATATGVPGQTSQLPPRRGAHRAR